MRFTVLFLPLQPQAVTDHAHAAQCHCRTRNHRVEQEAVNRVKDACRYRNADYVVDKRPEQVLLDGGYGLFGQAYCLRYLGQVGRNDGHLGYVHCDVAAFAHCDTYIGCCQCGAVVDTIAHHCHYLSFTLQFFHKVGFMLWQNFGFVMLDACLLRNGFSGSFIISGQHIQVNAHFLHFPDSLHRCFLNLIGDSDYSKSLLLFANQITVLDCLPHSSDWSCNSPAMAMLFSANSFLLPT